MIRTFRHIAHGGTAAGLTGWQRLMSYLVRATSFLVMLVFFLDAINADVLYASLQGNVRFEDNPLILDSQFDATSVTPSIGTAALTALPAHASGHAARLTRHIVPDFHGTTIVEDVDSPTVLDGASTATLTFSCKQYFSRSKMDRPSALMTLDRTITFACLLI